ETRRPAPSDRAAFPRGIFHPGGSRHPHDAQANSQPTTADQRHKLLPRSRDGVVLRAERVRDSLQLRVRRSPSAAPKFCQILYRTLRTDLSPLHTFSWTDRKSVV